MFWSGLEGWKECFEFRTVSEWVNNQGKPRTARAVKNRHQPGNPIWWESWSRDLVNWAQTCSTRCLSDLRNALRVYFSPETFFLLWYSCRAPNRTLLVLGWTHILVMVDGYHTFASSSSSISWSWSAISCSTWTVDLSYSKICSGRATRNHQTSFLPVHNCQNVDGHRHHNS